MKIESQPWVPAPALFTWSRSIRARLSSCDCRDLPFLAGSLEGSGPQCCVGSGMTNRAPVRYLMRWCSQTVDWRRVMIGRASLVGGSSSPTRVPGSRAFDLGRAPSIPPPSSPCSGAAAGTERRCACSTKNTKRRPLTRPHGLSRPHSPTTKDPAHRCGVSLSFSPSTQGIRRYALLMVASVGSYAVKPQGH